MTRMNLGCGPELAPGWVNVDVDERPGFDVSGTAAPVYLCHDMRRPFPVARESFDGVLMNHSLQQVRETEVHDVLVNVLRILRPGGCLRIIVPDVVAAFTAWSCSDGFETPDEMFAGFVAIEDIDPRDIDRKLTRYLTWNGTNLTCFTQRSLVHELAIAGYASVIFDQASHIDGLDGLDSRVDESIVCEAIKLNVPGIPQ